MFDVSNHVEDVRYGIQHCDFSKSPNSTMLASVLRMGVVVDRDPGIAASQRVVALGNRSTVEPAQLDLVFIPLDKHLRVDVQDHLLQVAVLLCLAKALQSFEARPEEDAGVDRHQEALHGPARFDLLPRNFIGF